MNHPTSPLQQTIGIVGLGLMGRSFVKRLDDAKCSLLGFDVNQASIDLFGKERYASLPELSASCKNIILAVFNSAQVEHVLFDDQGILATAKQPLNIICTSTCDPNEIKLIAEKTHHMGHRFLELPISGTSMQLARGDCLGLIGGAEQLAEDLAELLNVITPQRQYIGPAGDASKAKLSINLVLGLHRAALAEGLYFGVQLGLDPEKLLQTLQNSAAASSVMKIKGPLMVKRTYDNPQSKVDQSLKDFGLIQDLAHENDVTLPLAKIYIELLKSQLNDGKGHLDNAIIYEAIQQQRVKNSF
jgi:3-hydroxyisobutyrate dehydrogenase-like beta-hydroxyacid dehydrogenase